MVPRRGMDGVLITADNGNTLLVWGQAELSSSTTKGHAEAIINFVKRLAATGEYEFVTLQRAWRTATGRVATSGRMPDVIAVRKDTRVDAWEVKSDSDKVIELRLRLREGLNTLPPARRGTVDVIIIEESGE